MHKRVLSGWLSVLLLILTLPGFGQLITPRFETLDVEKGLSQNSVYRIYQDKRGFVWFGTSDGLNRYDGERMRAFKWRKEPLIMANTNVIRGYLCEDIRGRIWYANETGIYYFDPIHERTHQERNFLSDKNDGFIHYRGVMLDQQEVFWIAGPQGLVGYSLASGKTISVNVPVEVKGNQYITFIEPAGRYIYLSVTDHPGILCFDVQHHTFEWLFTEYDNLIVRKDRQGIFLIQQNKLYRYDSATQIINTFPITTANPIRHVLQDPFGRIWLATFGDGLLVYQPDGRRVQQFRHDLSKPQSLPFDVLTSLFIDDTNNLWIGTDGGGVARLDLKPPRFNLFPLSAELFPEISDYFIRCLYEDNRGRIWFGTLQNGLLCYDPNTVTLRKWSHEPGNPFSLPNNSVSALLIDRDGNWLIGHDGGVSLFDEQTNRFKTISLELHPGVRDVNNPVFQLLQLSSGDIMMASFYGTYLIRKDSKGFYHGSNWKGFSSNVTGLAQTPDGHIWIATQFQGLYHVRPEDPLVNSAKIFLGRINLRSIHQDEQHPEILWLCSGTGLIRFDTRTHAYRVYNEAHGISGDLVYGALEDPQHNFWLSTNSGLYYFDQEKESFQNFTVRDGLQSNEFNTGAFHKGASGTLYFGGIKGFNWFLPGAEQPREPPPRSGIIAVYANDISVSDDSAFHFSKKLSLNYQQNDLAFNFAVFDYSNPEANKIQYKLDDWDESWITSYTKTARYSNLPPGEYSLRMRASNSGEVWGEEDRVNITIQSPFWKTRWFYATVGMLVIGGVISITRIIAQRKLNRKLQELEKQQAVMRERERISKDIHDDLGSGLSKIAILSELARHSKGGDEFTGRQLDKISEASHELIDNLGELIWSHNPTNDSLKKLLWYIREHLSPIFDGTETRFTITIPDLEEDINVPAAWRRNIFLATKEPLHNILKHAKATEATLTYEISEGKLKMVVWDNGCGFEVNERTTSGNGLTNIRNRVEDCGGVMKIESKSGGGTMLQIEAPLT
jgi:signal transduction histidine kinase/ligand-binding sensor domain-containing protein